MTENSEENNHFDENQDDNYQNNKKNISFVRHSLTYGLIIFILFLTSCKVCADVNIIELNFKQDNNNKPVAINSYTIFFAGGTTGYLQNEKPICAKIYDINKKRIKNLNSKMNIPRNGYGVIKYDNNHILIVGSEDASKQKYAEIYNIPNNSFKIIENTPFDYSYGNSNSLFLSNNRIILFTRRGIIEFIPNKEQFKILIDYNSVGIDTLNFNFEIIELSDDEFLINASMLNLNKEKYNVLYKYELKNNKFYNIISEKSNSVYDHGIKLGSTFVLNNKIFSWYGNNTEGIISELDLKNKKIKYIAKTNFGTMGGNSLYIGKNRFLILCGCINSGEIFTLPKYLEWAILDLKKNKLSKVKIQHKSLGTNHIVSLGNNSFYIGRYYTDKKPLLIKIR